MSERDLPLSWLTLRSGSSEWGRSRVVGRPSGLAPRRASGRVLHPLEGQSCELWQDESS